MLKEKYNSASDTTTVFSFILLFDPNNNVI